MAAFTITHTQRLDNVAILQTLESTDISIGQSIVVSDNAGYAGTYIVQEVPIYLFTGTDAFGDYHFDTDYIIPNQLLVLQSGADTARATATGTVTWTQTCSWITSQNVLDVLGISPASANDTTFVATCTGAANAWAFVDSFASFESMGQTAPTASMGEIMRLLGINRSQVA